MVFVSEFGRNIPQNGSMGSEHGHGQCMWVLGGGINGGKVYGAWPGLAEKDRFVNNSLPGRTDYRDVLGEVLRKRGGVGSLSKIFPDHKPRALGLAKQR